MKIKTSRDINTDLHYVYVRIRSVLLFKLKKKISY